MDRCGSYWPGQCTAGACHLADWIPDGLGNGGAWADNARARGYQVTMVPTVGAVVSYCEGDGYSDFGHCGYVLDVYGDGTFLVREMNFYAPYQYDDRRSTTYDVCGFILRPGTAPGQGSGLGQGAGPGPGQLQIPGEIQQAWERLRTIVNDDWPGQAGFAQAVGLLVQQLPA